VVGLGYGRWAGVGGDSHWPTRIYWGMGVWNKIKMRREKAAFFVYNVNCPYYPL
jgi:hypothetical protein